MLYACHSPFYDQVGDRWLQHRVSYTSLRKFMYVTACCMSCMHHVDAPLGLSEGCEGLIFGFLQTNFREYLFHALR
jgi:hypothetical protein